MASETVLMAKMKAAGVVTLLGAALLCGCAQNPDKPEAGFEAPRGKMQAQGVALVADGCVLRDPGVGGYYLIGESRRLAAQAAKSAGQLLQENKIALKGMQMPFVCGSLAINPVSGAHVADGIEQTVRRVSLPMVPLEASSRDAALTEAYRRLLYVARADPETLNGELFTLEQAALLRQKLGSSSVLVVMIWGQSISAGATVSKELGCALMSVFGCGRMYQPDLDKSRSLASVIDLDTRAVIWTDVQRFSADDASLLFGGADPAHAENYSGIEWLRELTHPFFRN